MYTGPAPLVGLVAQTLQAEGLQVSAPGLDMAERDLSDSRDQVTVSLTVTATTSAVQAAVAKVDERLRGRGTVTVENDDDQRSEP